MDLILGLFLDVARMRQDISIEALDINWLAMENPNLVDDHNPKVYSSWALEKGFILQISSEPGPLSIRQHNLLGIDLLLRPEPNFAVSVDFASCLSDLDMPSIPVDESLIELSLNHVHQSVVRIIAILSKVKNPADS